MYRIWLRGALIAVAGLALLPQTSLSKDFCIHFGQASIVSVARGFTVPKKGTCKPWTGFIGGVAMENAPTVGTACTSSDGSHLSITYTGSIPTAGGIVFIDSITLSLPDLTGANTETNISQNAVTTGAVSQVTGAACKNEAIP